MRAVAPDRRRWSGRLALALLAPLAMTGTGCGFRLREAPRFSFQRIALAGFRPGSPMEAELRRAVADVDGLRIVESVSQAEVVLESLDDLREKAVVALTAAGQVREFELRAVFGFRVMTPAGRELIAPTQLRQVRDLSYSETLALAKEREEALLFRSMQGDIVTQVMRRLASIVLRA
jgi:LPS-assembly lipoprotein